MNGLSLLIRCGSLLICSWCSAATIKYEKQKLSLRFLGLIIAFLSDIHFVDGMYELPLLNSIVWNYTSVRSTQSYI